MTPTFYQVFSRNNDTNGNPYRLVLLYNNDGEVVQAIQYRNSFVDSTIKKIYPSIRGLYSPIHLTPSEYNQIRNNCSDLLIQNR